MFFLQSYGTNKHVLFLSYIQFKFRSNKKHCYYGLNRGKIVPFINISFEEANRSLKDPSLIMKLLKEKKINPKEADFLGKLGNYSRNPDFNLLDEIKEVCGQNFGDEAEQAFKKVFRFINSENKRVSWVIFSRHFQRIEYDYKNPLEDYFPRVSEVLTIKSRHKLVM